MDFWDRLFNNDWDKGKKNGIVIHFECFSTKTPEIFDRLQKRFLENTPRARRPLYMVINKTTHNFFAYFEYIEGVENPDQFKKKLKTIFNNLKLKIADYRLTVFPSNVFDTFHHYLFYCVEKTKSFDKNNYSFDRENDETDEEPVTQKELDGHLNSTDYVFHKYTKFENILQEVRDFITKEDKMTKQNTEVLAEKEEQKRATEKIKNDRKKLRYLESHKKEKFLELVETNYEFTGNLDDYVTKEELCNLSIYDDNSNKDTRMMARILTYYDVVYDKTRQINKKRGVFLGMRKLENKVL